MISGLSHASDKRIAAGHVPMALATILQGEFLSRILSKVQKKHPRCGLQSTQLWEQVRKLKLKTRLIFDGLESHLLSAGYNWSEQRAQFYSEIEKTREFIIASLATIENKLHIDVQVRYSSLLEQF